MKTHILSILSGSTDSTEQNSANETTAENRPGFTDHRARYQAFLNQRTSYDQPRLNRMAGPIRLLQGLFSVALFVAMFVAILTLVGFGLSSLGVIAQMSPDTVSASSKQNAKPAQASPSKVAPKKKAGRQ
ncbi:MAG: hypothetical protein ACRD82_14115 [Blastocatellia bacterium]